MHGLRGKTLAAHMAFCRSAKQALRRRFGGHWRAERCV